MHGKAPLIPSLASLRLTAYRRSTSRGAPKGCLPFENPTVLAFHVKMRSVLGGLPFCTPLAFRLHFPLGQRRRANQAHRRRRDQICN